jgi:hypothetical protein
MQQAEKPQIVEDPNLAAQQAQAQRSLIANLQSQAQIDTASIMARYGTKQALSAAGMSTPAPAPADSAPAFRAGGLF